MKKVIRTKLIHEGKYAAEVRVVLTETDDEWSPYPSLEDAWTTSEKRSLRRGDVRVAARHARIFTLTPVTA